MSFVVFTMIPMWGSICLGWVNLAYTRTTVKIPKFLGAASKHYRYMERP
jgi:hypothetical protein